VPIKETKVQVRQGKKVLHEQAFSHLLPNETMHMKGDWLAAVDLNGEPPEVALAG